MKRTFFLLGCFVLGIANVLPAQQLFGETPLPPFGFMASGDTSDYQNYSALERTGIIGANLLFGAGSYYTGHIKDGIILTASEAGGIFLLFLPTILKWNDFSTVTLGGMIGATVSYAAGGLALIYFLPMAIIWPLYYDKPHPKTAMLNDPRNWNVALIPGQNGNFAGQIAFTTHF